MCIVYPGVRFCVRAEEVQQVEVKRFQAIGFKYQLESTVLSSRWFHNANLRLPYFAVCTYYAAQTLVGMIVPQFDEIAKVRVFENGEIGGYVQAVPNEIDNDMVRRCRLNTSG